MYLIIIIVWLLTCTLASVQVTDSKISNKLSASLWLAILSSHKCPCFEEATEKYRQLNIVLWIIIGFN